MIDFAETIDGTGRRPPKHNEQEVILDNVTAQDYSQARSDPIDLARQLIAGKPAIFFALAFAIGGALGWLTSKR